MLLLWRNKVRIVICRDRLIVLHHASGKHPRIHSKQVFPYAGQEPGWQPLLAILAKVLKANDWKNTDAIVILSNHFVRFLVLPWNDAVLSGAEKMALLQHRFDEVYGETSSTLEFRLSEGSFGYPSIACAMPRALMGQIKDLFASTQVRLKFVQPYLMTAFNACRSELGKETAWFVLAERDNICIGLLQGGQWSSIRLRHVVNDWFEEAMLLLEREALLAVDGNKYNKVFVFAPEMAGDISIIRKPWSINRLMLNLPAKFSSAELPHYAMATAGI